MTTTKKINVNGTEISVLLQGNENDYICLTDMARFKDQKRTDYIIQNWMRSRSTIEYLGVWEQLHNPSFNSIEFDGFRQQAGLNAFSLTPKEWVEKTNAIGIQECVWGGRTTARRNRCVFCNSSNRRKEWLMSNEIQLVIQKRGDEMSLQTVFIKQGTDSEPHIKPPV